MKKMRRQLSGNIVSLLTPLKEDFELDEEGLRENVRWIIESGISGHRGGLIAAGSVGECYAMTLDERKRVIKAVVEEANGKVPVIAGTSHTGTGIQIGLAKYAREVGCDAVMASPPYYGRQSDDAIIAHYKAISDAVDIGIMIYNNIQFAGMDMSLNLLEKLAAIDNVAYIKEGTPDIFKFAREIRLLGDKVAVLSGGAEWWLPFGYELGSPGLIAVFPNWIPGACADTDKAGAEGNMKKVHDTYKRLQPLLELLIKYDQEPYTQQMISALKELSRLCNRPAGPARLPVLPLDQKARDEIKETAKKAGII